MTPARDLTIQHKNKRDYQKKKRLPLSVNVCVPLDNDFNGCWYEQPSQQSHYQTWTETYSGKERHSDNSLICLDLYFQVLWSISHQVSFPRFRNSHVAIPTGEWLRHLQVSDWGIYNLTQTINLVLWDQCTLLLGCKTHSHQAKVTEFWEGPSDWSDIYVTSQTESGNQLYYHLPRDDPGVYMVHFTKGKTWSHNAQWPKKFPLENHITPSRH